MTVLRDRTLRDVGRRVDALTAALLCLIAASTDADALQVQQYFDVERVVELSLSSDGNWLAYEAAKSSVAENRVVRQLYVQSLAAGSSPMPILTGEDVGAISWVPKKHSLAVLVRRHGVVELEEYNATDSTTRVIAKGSLTAFRFSPDGKAVAFTERPEADVAASLFSRLRDGNAGILIDTETASVLDFLKPVQDSPRSTLYVQRASTAPRPVAVPGSVQDFHWSTGGDALSITYVADGLTPSILRRGRSSVGVMDANSMQFHVVATAYPPSKTDPGRRYLGGEWVPGTRQIVLKRVIERDPWVSVSFPDWTVVDPFRPVQERTAVWHAFEAYASALVLPINSRGFLLESTVAGVHSLYDVSESGTRPAALVSGLGGTNSLFCFSEDRSRVAFVHEDFADPPEVYISIGRAAPRKLTSLNAKVKEAGLSAAKQIHWTSADGTTVSGWLLEPPVELAKRPLPVVTHIHGGPNFPMSDAFEPYWIAWPYPLQVYASHGIAVFLPNYRGTPTFGRSFALPTALDKEPVEDIISGIRFLIDTGVADPNRLGISGHSHGSWLGPLVMTRMKVFRAGSFAAGWGDVSTLYELSSGQRNHEIHDYMHGASLYDAPARYRELSPEMQFAGVTTATLFEVGALDVAPLMFGYPKAAQHAGAPAEFFIYPHTGHNPDLPRIQAESAERNLDWFTFWLKNEEDGSPRKAAQYKRWRALRDHVPTAR